MLPLIFAFTVGAGLSALPVQVMVVWLRDTLTIFAGLIVKVFLSDPL